MTGHICDNGCQYAKDVGMENHSCEGKCMYDNKPADAIGLGMKYDGDKPRMDLLVDGCPNALEAVAGVLTFGAKKYAAHSWHTVPEGEARYKAALLRHLTARGKGELHDDESGLLHLAHAACDALFILELEMRRLAKSE